MVMVLKVKYYFFDMIQEPISWVSIGTLLLMNFTPNFEGVPTLLVGAAYALFMYIFLSSKWEDLKRKRQKNRIEKMAYEKWKRNEISIEELKVLIEED